MAIRNGFRQSTFLLLAVYLVIVAFVFLYFNLRLTLESVVAILFVAAIVSGRGLLFLRDWGAFVAVLVAWQTSSYLALRFNFPWHLQELINADRFLFHGVIPPVWLQAHLYHPGVLEPWDVLAATMYMLHFLAPLAAGFLLWMTNRVLFHRFALTFVLVAVAGFATYIVYPSVPPWMAGERLIHTYGTYKQVERGGHVYLPHVQNLFDVIAGHWYNPYNGHFRLGFLHGNYDTVGAIPSEHAAYPMLFFLFLRRQFGRPAYLALVYVAALLFSITYLGQHYVIDAIVGFAYAICGYVLVMHGFPALAAARVNRRRAPGAIAVVQRAELEEA